MFKNVLTVTDFSPNSLKAMSPALYFARTFGAKVLICHVDEEENAFSAHTSDELVEFLREVEGRRSKWLEDLANQVREQGLEADIVRLKGFASREIVDYCNSEEIGLTTISALGSQGFKALLTGSTSANVLRHMERPLLFVGANCTPPEDLEVKRVLLPTVYAPVTKDALMWAAGFCKRIGAALDVLHVFKMPMYIPALPGEPPLAMPMSVADGLSDRFDELIKEVAGAIDFSDINWEVTLGEDEVDEISSAAISRKVDLIVMPRNRPGALEGLLFGRMPENVARLAPVPTLLYPAPVDEGERT